MTSRMWRPRNVSGGTIAVLAGLVDSDHYLRLDEAEQLPCAFGDHHGVDFLTGVVAATTIPVDQWALGTGNAPDGDLYMVKVFRYCKHDGTPHFNVDNRLLWCDADGNEWQLSSTEGGDHYRTALSGTGLINLSGDYAFPPGYSGPISDFAGGGVCVDVRGIAPDLIRAAGEKW
ncbi:MAG: hypothetical protein KAW67_00675 [Candidatus Eisenbacteria sp.]|nr:hypothetical protein [Candidatus Eisenbacteria bacterium]